MSAGMVDIICTEECVLSDCVLACILPMPLSLAVYTALHVERLWCDLSSYIQLWLITYVLLSAVNGCRSHGARCLW
jgi:hypothetical protein